ncbi:MAG: VCBS repeat-containing protein, partial [Salinibacter sp.]
SRSRSVPNGDRLYRKDGDGSFTNVTQEAGITGGGYGLGLAVSDVNKDGWPDVYAANDLYTRDRLYINQRDGTFADRSRQYLRHQSYSAMGVDIADFNNDRRSDIMVLDMLPKDPRRRRLISNVGTRADGMWQYGRNTLQLNNGVGPDGQMVFSEIGQLADVEATGWSWAPLLADYDNDGDRDLFVSNGYGKLVTHLDFVERRRQARFSGSRKENREALFKALRDLPTAHLTNRFFENEGSPEANSGDPLQFTERTGAWVTEHPGISNGAAFADFDRDGDLDLVTNNINEEATLLKNRTSERTHSNALRIDLHGPDGNRRGLGTKLLLFNDGTTQYHTFSPYRGYQSTVQGIVHFGLGADSTADSLKVVWPDGSTRFLTSVKANQVLDVHYEQARGTPEKEPPDSSGTARTRLLFRASADRRGLDHRHQETEMGDFRVNPLLPHRYSKNGPGIAVGDVDGNGLDDVFVGADLKHRSVLFRQQRSGRFRKQRLSFGGGHNDMGSLFFDADMDGDQDLYVVSGGNAGPPDNYKNTYQDRLYLNDGDGNFKRAKGSLPDITASGSVV